MYPDMICCFSTPIRAYVHSGETFSLISSSSHIPRYFVTGGCLTSFHTVSQSFLALRSNFDLNHQIHHRRRSACELDAELGLLHHIHSFLLEDGVPEDAVQGENDQSHCTPFPHFSTPNLFFSQQRRDEVCCCVHFPYVLVKHRWDEIYVSLCMEHMPLFNATLHSSHTFSLMQARPPHSSGSFP